ncbi:basic secretory protein-like protein [Blastopirellula marina]|nr:basic secretory protein-like protein [Blastopirellula marina]
MRFGLLLLSACLFVPSFALAAQEEAADKLSVVIDVQEVPELKEWSEQSEKLIREWHPKVTKILKQEGYTPPQEVRVVFKKDMDGVAYTVRNQITIAGDWVKQHPEDTGMVIHELAHVIQQYPRGGRSWLVEGIADYVRFYKYEPKTRLRGINPERQSYREGYRTSAQFIAWLEENNPGFVQKVNEALRKGEYRNTMIREMTGKSVDQLWTEFTESPAAKGRRK